LNDRACCATAKPVEFMTVTGGQKSWGIYTGRFLTGNFAQPVTGGWQAGGSSEVEWVMEG